jgi:hypothetical protein
MHPAKNPRIMTALALARRILGTVEWKLNPSCPFCRFVDSMSKSIGTALACRQLIKFALNNINHVKSVRHPQLRSSTTPKSIAYTPFQFYLWGYGVSPSKLHIVSKKIRILYTKENQI